MTLALLMVAACAAEDLSSPAQVDERLLAALGLAQSYQHQADELLELDQPEEALAKVRLVLEIDFPQGVPEAEDLRLDAWGRIAELHLAASQASEANEMNERAEVAVERGLAEATRESYFKARLFSVRGRILRARAEQHRVEGAEVAAREASRAAIAAFEESIAINRRILAGRDAGANRRDRR